MILLIVSWILFQLIISHGAWYARMGCFEDNDYINEYDGYHNNIQTEYFLNGLYSIHSNQYEDRRFEWKYCNAVDEDRANADPDPIQFIETFDAIGSPTEYDKEWQVVCPSTSMLIGGISTHDNDREDRIWQWKCGILPIKYIKTDCDWNLWYIEDYDGTVDYECPNSGVIDAIHSEHDNDREDRKWGIKCCRLMIANDRYYAKTICKDDEYPINNYGEDHNNIQKYGDYFLNGLRSVHDNGYEDRTFEWRYCNAMDETNYEENEESVLDPIPFSSTFAASAIAGDNPTDYESYWRISCGDSAAIIGGISTFDSSRKDRSWNWKCGQLQPGYELRACYWTWYLAEFDGEIDFECRYDGVIKAIISPYDAIGTADRRWQVTCCQMTRDRPTSTPTHKPTSTPTHKPTSTPTHKPTSTPTHKPTSTPTHKPTSTPTSGPTPAHTKNPTPGPTVDPTPGPTSATPAPTKNPTPKPTPPTPGSTTTESITRQCMNNSQCDIGFVCESYECLRDCNTFAIDEFLTQCSTEFNDLESEQNKNIKTIRTQLTNRYYNLQQQIDNIISRLNATKAYFKIPTNGGQSKIISTPFKNELIIFMVLMNILFAVCICFLYYKLTRVSDVVNYEKVDVDL